MTRIRLVWYWKRYMRKARYRCKRYFFYLPVALGDRLDLSVDYLARLFGTAIVLVPKETEFSLSDLENLGTYNRSNRVGKAGSLTNPLTRDSKRDAHSRSP
jgi:hypothetical protein